jgi:hypothetical protein
MSEQASRTSTGLPPATATVAEEMPSSDPAVVVEEEDEGGDADALRRRRRRRRRRSLKTDNPERRIRTFLLGLVVVLLILAVTGAQAGAWLKGLLATAKASGQFSGVKVILEKFFRWEVAALLIAAVVLVYLQPGVEEKVLRALGIKKERRRG